VLGIWITLCAVIKQQKIAQSIFLAKKRKAVSDMTKEQFEQAKALEQKISHITMLLEFITEHKRIDEASTNIFIDNEAGDFIALTCDEVECLYDAFECRKNKNYSG
jgi:hypothetical protein